MTDNRKVTHINTRRYWAITEAGLVMFEGTFNECWDELVATYGDKTLKEIADLQTRIQRIK